MKNIFTIIIIFIAFTSLNAQTWDNTHQIIKPAINTPEKILSADFNGDDLNDILVAYNDDNWKAHLSIFKNTNSDFFEETVISFDTTDLFPSFNPMSSISIVDIDNDGDLDIIAATKDVYILLNDGSGNFSDPVAISNNSTTDLLAYYVYAVDIDGDNDKDILVSYRIDIGGNPRIAFYENSNNSFVEHDFVIPFSPSQMSIGFNFGDFNGDGDIDVVYNYSTNAQIAENNGGDVFDPSTWANTHDLGDLTYAYEFIITDYNNDGAVDIISNKTSEFAVYTNTNNDFTFEVNSLFAEYDNNYRCIDMDTTTIQDTLNIILSIFNPYYEPIPMINFKYAASDDSFIADTIIDNTRTLQICLSDITNNGYIDIIHDYYDGNEHNLSYFSNASMDCEELAIVTQPVSGEVNIGQDYTFTIGVSGTLPTYQWYKNDLPIPNAIYNFYEILNADNSDAAFYKCEIENDCTDPFFSNSVELEIACADAIIISEQPVSQDIEYGFPVSFSFTLEDDNIVTSYQWKKNDEDIVDATNEIYTIDVVNYNDEANYTCEIRSTCDTVTTDASTLSVFCTPINITQQPIGGNVSSESYTLSVEVDDNVEVSSYQWYFNDNTIYDGGSFIGATTNELQINPFNINYEGAYFCRITTICDTAFTDTVNLNYITAIYENDETLISIYPNPSTGIFKIQTTKNNSSLEILDFTGKKVLSHSLKNQIETINLSDQPKGIYLIKIQSTKRIFTKKLIIK